MTDNKHEIAHLARLELLSPKPAESEDLFTRLLGMYVTRREGQSVYLRGYEDPYQWSLKITESPEAGLRHLALRTTSADALQRRATALSDANVDTRWHEDEFGYGATLSFDDPDGHEVSLVWEVEKYKAPTELASKILTRASKKPLQGLPVKRLDHVNLLAADVGSTRTSYQEILGYRRTEGLVDGDVEVGAWLSTNLLGHEIAIMRDSAGARGRLHHVAFHYGTQQALIDAAEMFREYDIPIEVGPDVHGVTQGAFLYVIEPGGNRIELFGNTGFLHLDPDAGEHIWDMPSFATAGMAIGGAQLPPAFFEYATPALSPEALADLRTLAVAAP